MGKNLTYEEREQIAYARYQIILPLLRLSWEEKAELIKEVAAGEHDAGPGRKSHLSTRTLWRWLKKYTEEGLKGLMPRERSDKGKLRAIEDAKINKALGLKKEIPKRSTRKIIRLLELNKDVKEEEVKPSTLSRVLQQRGYTKQELTGIQPKIRRRFQKDKPNSLWQGDVKDGIWLPDPANPSRMKKTYATLFIDDCSRLLPWGEFFWDEKLPCLETVFKKAIEERGIPDQVYVDFARIFCSDQFKLICAELGVEILYAPDAPSKGKIEKINQTLDQDFFPELIHAGVKSLGDTNKFFHLWREEDYHKRIHSETGKKPIEAWSEIKDIRKVSREKLDQVFLWRDKRTVNKETCLIAYETNRYEVIPSLRGKRVEIRFNPFDLSKIFIFYQGEFKCMATPYHMVQHQHKKVKLHEETKRGDLKPLESSISYFKALEEKANESKPHKLVAGAEPEPAPEISREIKEEHPLKFREADFYELVHKKLGKFTANECKKIKGYWREYGPFDEKLAAESITRTVETKGKTQNINYYLESIRREHLRRADEIELYKPNKENVIKFANLVNELANKFSKNV